MKHENSVNPCPSCEDKLNSAYPDLAKWFRESVKPLKPDCHIAWSYRGRDDQEQAFLDGKSKLHFPLSPHNKHDDHGNPCALALDLFQLDYNGIGRWPWAYFRDIANASKVSTAPIRWGGDFTHISDSDHYEWSKAIDS